MPEITSNKLTADILLLLALHFHPSDGAGAAGAACPENKICLHLQHRGARYLFTTAVSIKIILAGFSVPAHILNSLRSDSKMWQPRSGKAFLSSLNGCSQATLHPSCARYLLFCPENNCLGNVASHARCPI